MTSEERKYLALKAMLLGLPLLGVVLTLAGVHPLGDPIGGSIH
jgi:hypothetical protein